jgi:hypothetical protein
MASNSIDVYTAITLLFWRLPFLAIWLVGVIMAAVYWKRAPRVSAFVLIAMAIFIVQALSADIFTSAFMSELILVPERTYNP